jgi:acetylornithine deacetylase/succinyl-diaminopimelate desuccinylase-like protein
MAGGSEVERSRRAAARLALYLSLALVGGATYLLAALLARSGPRGADQAWVQVDWGSLPEVQIFQHYLQIDTSEDRGDERAGARFLADQLAEVGILAHVVELEDRKANLWAVFEGDDPRALVLHGHLDVEPVLHPEAWVFPPFSGAIDGPWIYGRGAFDMKSLTIAQLVALKELARRHPRPRRTVVFLGTSSEERGSDLGTRWLLREHPELSARFWGVLTEGGVVEGRSLEDLKYWGVAFAQKRFADVIACSGDRKRLEALRRDLAVEGRPLAPLRLPAEVRRFWEVYGPTRDDARIRQLLADPERLLRDPAAFLELPPYLRSMLRDEAVPFAVRPAEGGGWELPIKLHLLPDSDLQEVYLRLLPAWLTTGVELTLFEAPTAHRGSPLAHPLYREMTELLRHEHPGITTGPYFLPWTGTDARFFRRAGVPAYGFSPFFILTPDTLHIGSTNEKIALPGFVQGVHLYVRLLERLAG